MELPMEADGKDESLSLHEEKLKPRDWWQKTEIIAYLRH